MNEVTKLYELAGVEPNYDYFTFFDDKVHKIGRTMHLCKEELKHWLENYQKDYVAIKVIRVDKVYPPFTPQKQLKLIKFLLDKYCDIRIRKNLEGDYYIKSFNDISCFSEDFEETLASFTNTHLQDLTEEERKQIKNILESEVRE